MYTSDVSLYVITTVLTNNSQRTMDRLCLSILKYLIKNSLTVPGWCREGGMVFGRMRERGAWVVSWRDTDGGLLFPPGSGM